MNDPWLNIHSYAHAMLVEQIMALIGRASKDPLSYRRTLESFTTATPSRTLRELHESTLIEIRGNSCEAIFDFPALSLTETAGVIASADKGHAPGSSRETLQSSTIRQPLIKQHVLP